MSTPDAVNSEVSSVDGLQEVLSAIFVYAHSDLAGKLTAGRTLGTLVSLLACPVLTSWCSTDPPSSVHGMLGSLGLRSVVLLLLRLR